MYSLLNSYQWSMIKLYIITYIIDFSIWHKSQSIYEPHIVGKQKILSSLWQFDIPLIFSKNFSNAIYLSIVFFSIKCYLLYQSLFLFSPSDFGLYFNFYICITYTHIQISVPELKFNKKYL